MLILPDHTERYPTIHPGVIHAKTKMAGVVKVEMKPGSDLTWTIQHHLRSNFTGSVTYSFGDVILCMDTLVRPETLTEASQSTKGFCYNRRTREWHNATTTVGAIFEYSHPQYFSNNYSDRIVLESSRHVTSHPRNNWCAIYDKYLTYLGNTTIDDLNIKVRLVDLDWTGGLHQAYSKNSRLCISDNNGEVLSDRRIGELERLLPGLSLDFVGPEVITEADLALILSLDSLS